MPDDPLRVRVQTEHGTVETEVRDPAVREAIESGTLRHVSMGCSVPAGEPNANGDVFPTPSAEFVRELLENNPQTWRQHVGRTMREDTNHRMFRRAGIFIEQLPPGALPTYAADPEAASPSVIESPRFIEASFVQNPPDPNAVIRSIHAATDTDMTYAGKSELQPERPTAWERLLEDDDF